MTIRIEGDFDRSATMFELSGPTGEHLYRGPIGDETALQLPLATWIDRINVKVIAPNLERAIEAEVRNGSAVIQ